ncbi:MAG: hypothetical protein IJO06_11450 [Thermoguttaceae bacterium]|nr:hypothetical protein [Thermoguttaceae bacterium]
MLKKFAFSWVAASLALVLGANAWAQDASLDKTTADAVAYEAAAIPENVGTGDCGPSPCGSVGCNPCDVVSCDPCDSVCCDPCSTISCGIACCDYGCGCGYDAGCFRGCGRRRARCVSYSYCSPCYSSCYSPCYTSCCDPCGFGRVRRGGCFRGCGWRRSACVPYTYGWNGGWGGYTSCGAYSGWNSYNAWSSSFGGGCGCY